MDTKMARPVNKKENALNMRKCSPVGKHWRRRGFYQNHAKPLSNDCNDFVSKPLCSPVDDTAPAIRRHVMQK